MTLNPPLPTESQPAGSPPAGRLPGASSGLSAALRRMLGIGVQFGAVISLFALLGYWLDERMGSSPWLLLLGVLLGFVGGTISLVKAVARLKENTDGEPPPPT